MGKQGEGGDSYYVPSSQWSAHGRGFGSCHSVGHSCVDLANGHGSCAPMPPSSGRRSSFNVHLPHLRRPSSAGNLGVVRRGTVPIGPSMLSRRPSSSASKRPTAVRKSPVVITSDATSPFDVSAASPFTSPHNLRSSSSANGLSRLRARTLARTTDEALQASARALRTALRMQTSPGVLAPRATVTQSSRSSYLARRAPNEALTPLGSRLASKTLTRRCRLEFEPMMPRPPTVAKGRHSAFALAPSHALPTIAGMAHASNERPAAAITTPLRFELSGRQYVHKAHRRPTRAGRSSL